MTHKVARTVTDHKQAAFSDLVSKATCDADSNRSINMAEAAAAEILKASPILGGVLSFDINAVPIKAPNADIHVALFICRP